jgi:hypothetical protein
VSLLHAVLYVGKSVKQKQDVDIAMSRVQLCMQVVTGQAVDEVFAKALTLPTALQRLTDVLQYESDVQEKALPKLKESDKMVTIDAMIHEQQSCHKAIRDCVSISQYLAPYVVTGEP